MTDKAGTTTTYGYNATNSLTAGTQKDGGGATLNTYGYGYDSAGNLNSKTINSTQTTINYNANNLPTSATGGMTASYSYNGQGDLTSRTVNGVNATFGYNNAGQLTNLNGSSQTYTGTGVSQRIGAGSNSYQYEAGGLKNQTVSGTGTDFTTLPDGSIIGETFSGSTFYYLSDGLGSVAALTDASGNIADQYAYDPLGNVTSTSGSVSNPFTFQGGIYDSVNKLYYTGSGYYDPATGQSFGCKDKGHASPDPRLDASEDKCGEDEWSWDKANLAYHWSIHKGEFAPDFTIEEYEQLGIAVISATPGDNIFVGDLNEQEILGYSFQTKDKYGHSFTQRVRLAVDIHAPNFGFYATGNENTKKVITLFIPGEDPIDYYCNQQKKDLGYYRSDCKSRGY
jgi:YD repeat-containing protein